MSVKGVPVQSLMSRKALAPPERLLNANVLPFAPVRKSIVAREPADVLAKVRAPIPAAPFVLLELVGRVPSLSPPIAADTATALVPDPGAGVQAALDP